MTEPLLKLQGKLSGGGASRLRDAQCWVDGAGWVTFPGEPIAAVHARHLCLGPRVGDAVRRISLPDGHCFETREHATLAALEQRWLRPDPIYVIEQRKRWYLLLMVLLVAATLGWVKWLNPALASLIARQLPPSISAALANEVMQQLDQRVLTPSALPEQSQAHYQQLFAALATKYPGWPWQLQLRQGNKVGANALALPNGTIVITDELIKLPASDHEVQAVMLHEMGHVIGRHALRSSLEAAGLSLPYLWVTGDQSAIAEALALVPYLLTTLHYSRELEREADRFAVSAMAEQQVPPHALGSLLAKLAQQGDKGEASPLSPYLSTHPQLAERIAAASQ